MPNGNLIKYLGTNSLKWLRRNKKRKDEVEEQVEDEKWEKVLCFKSMLEELKNLVCHLSFALIGMTI